MHVQTVTMKVQLKVHLHRKLTKRERAALTKCVGYALADADFSGAVPALGEEVNSIIEVAVNKRSYEAGQP